MKNINPKTVEDFGRSWSSLDQSQLSSENNSKIFDDYLYVFAYVIRTFALDRFGTRIEKRFSKRKIGIMLENAGLKDIHFSDKQLFWCAVGIKDKICAV